MTKKREFEPQDFEKLLFWLDEDRDAAGQKYESIRHRLIKIFSARGCPIPDELSDETIDRVTQKINHLTEIYQGDPALYFYAVGKKVLFEFFKKPVAEELSSNLVQKDGDEDDSEMIRCLRVCLQTLTKEQSSFILSYYGEEKQAKIAQRKLLAEENGMTGESLRIKAFRIKRSLEKCVRNCLAKKNM